MKRRLVLIALSPLAPFAGSAVAQSVNSLPATSTITFPPGSNSSVVTGQVAPGNRAVYFVTAKAGQTLMVSVTAAAAVAFQVFKPNTTLANGADGTPVITGPTLPDAGPSDNAKAWIGAIPQDGSYLIAVGLVGGGSAPAPFSLTVSLQ